MILDIRRLFLTLNQCSPQCFFHPWFLFEVYTIYWILLPHIIWWVLEPSCWDLLDSSFLQIEASQILQLFHMWCGFKSFHFLGCFSLKVLFVTWSLKCVNENKCMDLFVLRPWEIHDEVTESLKWTVDTSYFMSFFSFYYSYPEIPVLFHYTHVKQWCFILFLNDIQFLPPYFHLGFICLWIVWPAFDVRI